MFPHGKRLLNHSLTDFGANPERIKSVQQFLGERPSVTPEAASMSEFA